MNKAQRSGVDGSLIKHWGAGGGVDPDESEKLDGTSKDVMG